MAEKLFTSLFAAFAGFVIWESWRYGVFSSTITGPGFFPAIAGSLMLLSTVASLLMRKKAAGSPPVAEADAEDSGQPSIRIEILRASLLVGLTALFIIASPAVGMVALTPFYVFACFLALTPDFRPTRVAIGVMTAIFFTLLAWLIFDRALGVPMPRGLF